ncbi:GGDEF domain-containing protein [Planctomicrobium sp. SH661]|uniref:GGDEF domain-containing protein n=1 Tax=Planctomicrobium sp. SH661 TaxID=3448124 RepID=UPI003F5B797F
MPPDIDRVLRATPGTQMLKRWSGLISVLWLALISIATAWGERQQTMVLALLLCVWPARRLGWQNLVLGGILVPLASLAGICWGARGWPAWNLNLIASPILLAAIGLTRTSERIRQETIRGTDALTGLFNRQGFELRAQMMARLSLAQSLHSGVAVACLDCDSFKEFNDRHGHRAGDELLMQAANVLRRSASPGLAARLGGDEFCLIWLDVTLESARARAERLQKELASTISTLGEATTWSIGVAVYTELQPIEQMIDRADLLMLSGKSRNKGSLTVELIPTATP